MPACQPYPYPYPTLPPPSLSLSIYGLFIIPVLFIYIYSFQLSSLVSLYALFTSHILRHEQASCGLRFNSEAVEIDGLAAVIITITTIIIIMSVQFSIRKCARSHRNFQSVPALRIGTLNSSPSLSIMQTHISVIGAASVVLLKSAFFF